MIRHPTGVELADCPFCGFPVSMPPEGASSFGCASCGAVGRRVPSLQQQTG
jgi:LSD1 subclass zinc finger protein